MRNKRQDELNKYNQGTIRNPWLRYVAHKLNVIDKALCSTYYNEVGHSQEYLDYKDLRDERIPSNKMLNKKALSAMEEIVDTLTAIHKVHLTLPSDNKHELKNKLKYKKRLSKPVKPY
tara:strand:+ start:4479 stop:4832 length:354 start_codon:yes stop_codon:yes gene_type:complete